MKYVDGFVFVLPRRNLQKYKKMALLGKKVWLKHGALDYQECIADDLRQPQGKLFKKMTKLKKGEVAAFSYIVYKSRSHRDRVNARVMKEFADSDMSMTDIPFDLKRMAAGGFKVIVGK